MAANIKTGDKVIVTTGAHKGTVGTVKKVLPDANKLVVEGVNRVKRHMKPSARKPEGGIVEKELPIHRSNVMLIDPSTGKATRARVKVGEDGKKLRIAVKSGVEIADVKATAAVADAG